MMDTLNKIFSDYELTVATLIGAQIFIVFAWPVIKAMLKVIASILTVLGIINLIKR